MIVCGLKLTHDAAIALIDNGKLIFSLELEKLKNNDRHIDFYIDIEELNRILASYSYSLHQIDVLVFDGWHEEKHHLFKSSCYKFALEEYGTRVMKGDVLREKQFEISYNGSDINCKSYTHVAGHLSGAYCSSIFAKTMRDSYVLVWDGGMFPQLYYYCVDKNQFEPIKDLFTLTSNAYILFAGFLQPFRNSTYHDLALAGKAMAFASYGQVSVPLLSTFHACYSAMDFLDSSTLTAEDFNVQFISAIMNDGILANYSHADLMMTFQKFLEELLLQNLRELVQNNGEYERNLCFVGGAALNIIWNEAIRTSGIFNDVWIPPFPNDSGSALGTACCELLKHSSNRYITWDVYSGPELIQNGTLPEWEDTTCSVKELAHLLHFYKEPILFLSERAELGPRALGNRSILAPATELAMRHLLNQIKEREAYRPVAPICLREFADEVFSPGGEDPFMLFSHTVKEGWVEKIPAVCHVDGTARLQTIDKFQNKNVYELLNWYYKLSGIPLLCNTSANMKGKGFFPDIQSALRWGKVNLVWSNGRLYMKNGHSRYLYLRENKEIFNSGIVYNI